MPSCPQHGGVRAAHRAPGQPHARLRQELRVVRREHGMPHVRRRGDHIVRVRIVRSPSECFIPSVGGIVDTITSARAGTVNVSRVPTITVVGISMLAIPSTRFISVMAASQPPRTAGSRAGEEIAGEHQVRVDGIHPEGARGRIDGPGRPACSSSAYALTPLFLNAAIIWRAFPTA